MVKFSVTWTSKVGWLVGKVTFKDRFFHFEKGHGFESPAIFVCEFFWKKLPVEG